MTKIRGGDDPTGQLLLALIQAMTSTQETSRYREVEALWTLVPAYIVVAHHTAEALSLRASVEETVPDLKRFIQRH
jgi:hypothetical protein